MMINKQFGNKINERRKELDIKAEDLAAMCETEPGYIRQILAGQVPSSQMIIKLCKYLKLSPNYLFDFVDEESEDKEILETLNQMTPKEKRMALNLLNYYIEKREE